MLLKVCFEVYYLNGDGYISREEIFEMLKNSIHQDSPEETDEGIRELVDIIVTKMVRKKNCNALYSFKYMLYRAKNDFLHNECNFYKGRCFLLCLLYKQ